MAVSVLVMKPEVGEWTTGFSGNTVIHDFLYIKVIMQLLPEKRTFKGNMPICPECKVTTEEGIICIII